MPEPDATSEGGVAAPPGDATPPAPAPAAVPQPAPSVPVAGTPAAPNTVLVPDANPTPTPVAPQAPQPAAEGSADAPTVDPKLAHVLAHYLPKGIDINLELKHVVENIDANGNKTYDYRPLLPTAKGDATVDVPVTTPTPVGRTQGSTTVAPAPHNPFTPKTATEFDGMSDTDFEADNQKWMEQANAETRRTAKLVLH